MRRVDEIRELFAYNRWANLRVLEAVRALSEEQFTQDLGSSFSSVRDTLVHTLSAEWVWLSRWRGVSPRAMPKEWESSTYGELREHWRQVEAEQRAFLSELTEVQLDDVVSYANLAGTAFASPLWQMLRHVVNHSTYHRGQAVTMLRQLGAPAPSTDLIHFFRTGGLEDAR